MPTNMRGLAPSQLKDLNLTNKWDRDYEQSGGYNYTAYPFLERNGKVDSTLVKLKAVKHRISMLTLLDINLQIDHTYFLRALCRTRSHIIGICILRSQHVFEHSPVIHCSAGIGRSGTFAFVDIVLTLLAASEGCNSHAQLMNILHNLRNERPGLIQTPEQLRFCFLSIIRAFCDVNMKINPKWISEFIDFIEEDSSINLKSVVTETAKQENSLTHPDSTTATFDQLITVNNAKDAGQDEELENKKHDHAERKTNFVPEIDLRSRNRSSFP
ncbi:hypothetical protein GJ496_004974 [Pomphorhynchus laevis]|nr:hypothetical protein GJ496_004974 [Pomphorhynchus laevis]